MTMNIKFIAMMSCLLVLASSHFAQDLNFNRPIDTIQFSGLSSSWGTNAIDSLSFQTKPNSLVSIQNVTFDINAIYQTGYFSKVSTETALVNNKHTLFFHLVENPIITHLDIRTSNDRIKTIIYQMFSPLIKSPLNSLILGTIKQTCMIRIKELGFEFIDLTDIIYDKPNKTLRIIVSEATIESISFNGLNNLTPPILLREMTQKNGKIFNSLDLRKDRERLIGLGYFNSISPPQLSKGSSANLIKVTFDVVEKKLNKVSSGLEQDQIRYFGFISNRRHNFLIRSDLLTIKTQIQLADSNLKLNRYSIGYTQPWLFNTYHISASLTYYNLEKQEVIYNQTTRSLRQGQKMGITIPFSDFFSLNSSLKFENIARLYESDDILPYSIHSYDMILLYETINNRLNPSAGSRFYFNIEQGNNLGFIQLGGLSFTRISSSATYYVSVNSNLILASRLKGGIFYPIHESIYTYENEYFILGGSRSIRGYNEANSPFSGRRHLLMNFELRYLLSTNFQSIVFIDYGNAFNQTLRLANFHTGYGLGFRYHTPIGPIRVDFAQGTDSMYIHFGLGHMF
ncbi:hypothetical protein DID74_01065 [Candidatus Marinamargulisbacteria bacterium SCGC AG-333-B06]|nr:hypothetical protein DID74_01065 [Candidatus Marinamargulisbacteria bacterium SCGC AG-333-B06]